MVNFRVGRKYKLNQSYLTLPKGFKTILLCRYRKKMGNFIYEGGLITVPKYKGCDWKYFDIYRWLESEEDTTILEMLDEIGSDVFFLFIPISHLGVIENGDKIILDNIVTVWNSRITDTMNEFNKKKNILN